ncbi:hypothetical protein LJR164_001649 [Phenylobacterium sp. LjRoot164]|uniref:hypothetical protein n=1 Tax=unclassified Phenylobacterium TaxID=2640670 RepID=UPI003ECCC0E5
MFTNPLTTLQTRLVVAAVALLVIVGVLSAAYFTGANYAAKKERAAAEKVIKPLRDDLAACNVKVDNLTDALEVQNAAVDRMEAEARERSRRADAAIAEARRKAAIYKAKADRLARAQPGPDMCASARSLIIDSLSEDRK